MTGTFWQAAALIVLCLAAAVIVSIKLFTMAADWLCRAIEKALKD